MTHFIHSTEKLCAKPRMTQSAKWKYKTDPRLQEYFGYVNELKWKYKGARGKLYVQPVAIGCIFYFNKGQRRDLDNILKGIKDALKGLAWINDNLKWIRGYDYMKCYFIDEDQPEKFELRIRPLNNNHKGEVNGNK